MSGSCVGRRGCVFNFKRQKYMHGLSSLTYKVIPLVGRYSWWTNSSYAREIASVTSLMGWKGFIYPRHNEVKIPLASGGIVNGPVDLDWYPTDHTLIKCQPSPITVLTLTVFIFYFVVTYPRCMDTNCFRVAPAKFVHVYFTSGIHCILIRYLNIWKCLKKTPSRNIVTMAPNCTDSLRALRLFCVSTRRLDFDQA